MFDDKKIYLAGDPALRVLGGPSTLAHWRSASVGPKYIKLGSRIGYRGGDINDWLEAQTVEPNDNRGG